MNNADPGPRVGRARRGPIDPRLWRYARSARRYLALSVALSVANIAAVIVTAISLATILAGVITGARSGSGGAIGSTIGPWAAELGVLGAALSARALLAGIADRYSQRSAARVITELQHELLESAVHRPPRTLDQRRDTLGTLITRGISDLGPYLTGYVPALLSAALLTPAVVLTIAWFDLASAGIALVTLPLIPIFMALIGWLTQARAEQTLRALTRLSAQTLDLIAGLPTLRALGREHGPQRQLRRLGDEHRRATMSSLRVAFLSSMVLELLATLSVALIAVGIGMRLVYGDMDLRDGLIALILAPEVYLPLRQVGAQFHAAADGVAAAAAAFDELDQVDSEPSPRSRTVDASGAIICFDRLTVAARAELAPSGLTARCEPGSITVLSGANGSGKSTALLCLLGLCAPTSGAVSVGGIPVDELDPRRWWAQLAWLPQRPALIPGSIAENLQFFSPLDPHAESVQSASRATGFDAVLDAAAHGWETPLGTSGLGLSLGERQRLALTRVLSSPHPVLLLDEPTAHLDEATEARVLAALRARADSGATVLVIGHRPAVLAAADRVFEVHSGVDAGANSGVDSGANAGVRSGEQSGVHTGGAGTSAVTA